MMDNTLKLKEYDESNKLQLRQDHLDLLLAKFDNQLKVKSAIDRSGYIICSNSYVGVYDLDDFKIVVEPKIDTANVFKMLSYSYDLIFWHDEKAQFANIQELLDYLVLVFCNQVNRLIKKGLHADYVLVNDKLSYAKGRMNVRELVEKPWEKHKIDCYYDNYQVDILENQIIKFTIDLLKRYIQNNWIRRSLLNTNRYFDSVSLRPITVEDIDQVQYTTLNKHYKHIHNFCKMFLELMGINEQIGETLFNQFHLEMNNLYEKYVGKLLKEELPNNYCVILQDKLHLDEYDQISIRPDIVIYNDVKPYLVIDTKYKGSKDITNNDIYQMAAYMSKTKTDGVLLYPAQEVAETEYIINGRSLNIKTIDLQNLDDGAKDLINWIIKV
ncbi:McrC family protein [Natranaerobius thermophilus]|uniref:McrBC 5-methylcytosine restriction system component-like protein n=1 Tax=Natranaerobius thermophilus (strain ATCC BAA-1301 / DSM 18059 / JW/NM-WN-LF) TaxID=457570 RepID=B2A7U4_NATTJ|nr:McrBC 5-methylcytosine restriction system component-like protein [Natranaerobius thermophilus]ACB84392.1 McrBC 5-methylcytosine restriction system component-like protein [Natranaerobius thermophilus JW/NM-WN-LF]